MRLLAYASLLTSAGCSLIYNPSNLPAAPGDGGVDQMVDAREIIDADPTMPSITAVDPKQLFEGTGTGFGRQAVVVVTGENFVPGAKIIIAKHGETTQTSSIVVDDAKTDVSEDHKMVAAPLTIAVDATLDANDPPERLDVIVTQPAGGSMGMVAFTALANDMPVLERVGLDELNDTNFPTGGLSTNQVNQFSEITLTTKTLVASNAANPLQIRVTGGVSIDTTDITPTGQAGGPGAPAGGNGGGILGAGAVGGGAGGGGAAGSGGGFGTNGSGTNGGGTHGDEEIVKLGGTGATSNVGSGGGGGNGGALSGGSPGGGGGGTIEITANGQISLKSLAANGGPGGTGDNQDGGGGSGGLVLLRGSNVILDAAGSLTAIGGSGNAAGGAGRIRIDSAAATIPVANPVAYRGPMLAAATPVIVRDFRPELTFLGQGQRKAQYQISNADGSSVRNFVEQDLGSGSNKVPLEQSLFEGLNTICLYVEHADKQMAEQRPEARNCIQIVYLFKNQ